MLDVFCGSFYYVTCRRIVEAFFDGYAEGLVGLDFMGELCSGLLDFLKVGAGYFLDWNHS